MDFQGLVLVAKVGPVPILTIRKIGSIFSNCVEKPHEGDYRRTMDSTTCNKIRVRFALAGHAGMRGVTCLYR